MRANQVKPQAESRRMVPRMLSEMREHKLMNREYMQTVGFVKRIENTEEFNKDINTEKSQIEIFKV